MVVVVHKKGLYNQALDTLKDSANVINTISAEQIEKSPDSDAGQAIQPGSGVPVEDGKYD